MQHDDGDDAGVPLEARDAHEAREAHEAHETEAAQAPKRRAGAVMTVVVGTAVAIAVVLAAATILGRSSSSKFESVASAICESRMHGGGAMGGAIDAPVVGVIGGGGEVLGAQAPCGGGYAPTAGATPAAGGAASATGAGAPGAPAVTTPPLAPGQTSFGANALDAGTVAADTASAAADDAPSSPGPAAAGHSFVSTATMTVTVAGDTAKDVAEQKRRALAIAAGAGGGLFGEQSAFDGEARATVTLKVPSAQFTKVLEDLAGLGTIKAQEVKTDEVTLQVIDLQARITAATNGLDRTRGLLAKATNLGDVAQLEADVNRRETEVENLRGQQAALAQRVELSTVVLTLVSSAPVAAPPPPPVVAAPAPLPGFLDGLEKGWGAFTKAGSVGLAGVGVALPFLPFVVAAFVGWRVLRRRKIFVRQGTSVTT